MKSLTARALLLLCAVVLFGSPLRAESLPSQILTERGELVSLQRSSTNPPRSGDVAEAAPSASELALVLRSPAGAVRRWPVAESTEGLLVRGLVYHEDLGQVFVVWESPLSGGRSRLHLGAHDLEGWVGARAFPSPGGAFLGSALLSATRASDGSGAMDARLHVAGHVEGAASPRLWVQRLESGWSDQAPAGFDLTELLAPARRAGETVRPDDLLLLRSGADHTEVLLGVTDAASHDLLVVRISPVPDDLSALAADARAQITRVGATAPSHEALSQSMGRYLRERASAYDAELGGFMAYAVERVVLETDAPLTDDGLKRLGQDARAQITRVGLRPRGRKGAGGLEPWLQHAGARVEAVADERDALLVDLVAAWPLPDLVPDASLLFLSGDGRRGLFVSIQEGAVLVIQGTEGQWSEVENLGEADVLVDLDRLLQRRVEWASESLPDEGG